MKNTLRAFAGATALTVASVGLLAAPAGAESQTRTTDASSAVYDGSDAYVAEDDGDAKNSTVHTFAALAWCKKVGGDLGVAMCGTLIAQP